jgi:hypothetical protein
MFVIMSQLKFFSLMGVLKFFSSMGVLTQNFNIVDLVKFLETNQKLHIQIITVTLKVTLCRTMSKKKSEKNEKPRFYEQNKLLF